MGSKPLSELMKFRLGTYDYIGTTTGDGAGFYADLRYHDSLTRSYIFKDWESRTWIGTVISSFSFIMMKPYLILKVA